MATTHIGIDQTKNYGSQLRNAIGSLKSADKDLNYLKEKFETLIDGTDYTALETELGLSAGQGETVYNLVAGAIGELNANNIHQLLIRLG